MTLRKCEPRKDVFLHFEIIRERLQAGRLHPERFLLGGGSQVVAILPLVYRVSLICMYRTINNSLQKKTLSD